MPTKLTAAIEGFEAQKRRIDVQIGEIRELLKGMRTEPPALEPPNRKRKMSAAARKRIGDAQKKRWAESRRQSEPLSKPVASEAPQPKRKISAAGRKRIVEATKKRWAAFHAAKKAEKGAVVKKATRKKAVGKKTAAAKGPVVTATVE